MRWGSAAAFVASCSGGPVIAATSPSLELKGIALGTTREQFSEQFPALKCARTDEGCVYLRKSLGQNITELNTLAEELVIAWVFLFAEDTLASIYVTFDKAAFATILSAFAEKFGPPSTTQSSRFQNQMGAVFEGKEFTWKKGAITMRLSEYASKVSESSVTLSDDALLSRRTNKENATRRAKDL